jgi:hypothetical protein
VGEGRLAAESFSVVASGYEKRGDDVGSDSRTGDELRGRLADERLTNESETHPETAWVRLSPRGLTPARMIAASTASDLDSMGAVARLLNPISDAQGPRVQVTGRRL